LSRALARRVFVPSEEQAHPPRDMASTIWKGQLTFGLVSFPVRLQKAARRERIALKYVRETRGGATEESEPDEAQEEHEEPNKTPPADAARTFGTSDSEAQGGVTQVRQGYFSEGQREPSSTADLQRGYEVTPNKFVVVRPEELERLRKATSPDMQILRSVKMKEIDPVFLETSYYVIPGPGGEKPYGLFYRALNETQLAALAQVAMHGREHVIVLRAGGKGLIAHTMFYVNEVRGEEEYAAETADVVGKELDLAKKYIEALMEPFRSEEFNDGYRMLVGGQDGTTRDGHVLKIRAHWITMLGGLLPLALSELIPDPAKYRKAARIPSIGNYSRVRTSEYCLAIEISCHCVAGIHRHKNVEERIGYERAAPIHHSDTNPGCYSDQCRVRRRRSPGDLCARSHAK
jgi:DNA end-binding protein Ku